MALEYHGLRTDPFNPEPSANPYLGSADRNAPGTVYYHIEQGEKVPVLVGPTGAGKTTLLRLIEKSQRAHGRTLVLAQCPRNECELQDEIFRGLGISSVQAGVTAKRTQIRELLTSDTEVVRGLTVFLDDAQKLDESGLNLISSLSLLPVSQRRNFRLVLAGCTDLNDRLTSPELGGVFDRILLAPMAAAETEAYINHRLHMAGWTGRSIFLTDACAAISEWTDGIRKRVNEVCSAALRLAVKHEVQQIDAAWLEGNVNPSSAATSGGSIRFESLANRLTATNTCVGIFTIAFATAFFYILQAQFGNQRAVRPTLSASVTQTIDKKVPENPSAGSLKGRRRSSMGAVFSRVRLNWGGRRALR
jgi:general secretion pathway protein A